jgi:type IV secretion system protein TrbL
VVTGAGATIIEALLTGFDAMARWVLDNGFDGTAVGLRLAALGNLPGTGGGLVFLLAFFGMVASLVQVGIMLVRGAILAVLVGLLPVAAASAITETGYEWFKKLADWIGSFTLYKLVAAVVYAAAFTIIGDATDLAGVVSGFSLMIVSILALPALLRLLPPAAGAIGGGLSIRPPVLSQPPDELEALPEWPVRRVGHRKAASCGDGRRRLTTT